MKEKGKVCVPGSNLPPKDASLISRARMSFFVVLWEVAGCESVFLILIRPTSRSLSKYAEHPSAFVWGTKGGYTDVEGSSWGHRKKIDGMRTSGRARIPSSSELPLVPAPHGICILRNSRLSLCYNQAPTGSRAFSFRNTCARVWGLSHADSAGQLTSDRAPYSSGRDTTSPCHTERGRKRRLTLEEHAYTRNT